MSTIPLALHIRRYTKSTASGTNHWHHHTKHANLPSALHSTHHTSTPTTPPLSPYPHPNAPLFLSGHHPNKSHASLLQGPTSLSSSLSFPFSLSCPWPRPCHCALPASAAAPGCAIVSALRQACFSRRGGFAAAVSERARARVRFDWRCGERILTGGAESGVWISEG